jgi:tetratricopeptide (TPR) repeat protein
MLWHAAGLAAALRLPGESLDGVLARVSRLAGLSGSYFLFNLALVFGLAGLLSLDGLRQAGAPAGRARFFAPLVLAAVLWLAAISNLRPVQADIAFKQAEIYESQGAWETARVLYQRAAGLAPREDHYLLFQARATLELAKLQDDPSAQEALFLEAQALLEEARAINPLNTDNTANLARLYNNWAAFAEDPQTRATLAQAASESYAQAVTLSPNNARLWAEWASLYLALLPDLEAARQRLDRAIALDASYDWTYGLLGEYYLLASAETNDPQEQRRALLQAAEHYAAALRLSKSADPQLRSGYAVALAGAYVRLDRPGPAIQAYEQAVAINPETPGRWQIEEALSRLYAQSGHPENALAHAVAALELAPEAERGRLEEWIQQVEDGQR